PDERGNTKWNQSIAYTLADVDLVVIDATGAVPRIQAEVSGVGTEVGNAVMDPAGDRLFVLNTEAHNEIRFEPNLRGRFASTRLGVVDLSNDAPRVRSVDLNPHINLDLADGSDAERALSLALPADIARGADGTLYVAATGPAHAGLLHAAGRVPRRISRARGP